MLRRTRCLASAARPASVRRQTVVPVRGLTTRAVAPARAAISSRATIEAPKLLHVRPARSFHGSPVRSATGQRVQQTTGVVQYKLTDVGEGIAECEILKWYVAEGDRIKAFQKLCEVQSDKATLDITSRYDGIVKKLHYKKGDMAKVGSPLADIDLGGTSAAAESKPAAPAPSPAKPSSSLSPAAASPSPSPSPSSSSAYAPDGKVLTTPAVRRLSREAGLSPKELSSVRATGKDGRLTKEDLLNHISARDKPAAPAAAATSTPAAAASVGSKGVSVLSKSLDPAVAQALSAGQDARVPIRGLTRTMVKTMTASALIPQLGYTEEFRMEALTSLRAELKPQFEAAGVKLTYLPFILKAVSLALRSYPVLNAAMPSAEEIVYKARHNIGIAMDTPAGLLVPNVKDVQARSVFQIAQELSRLQKEGASGKLTAGDLADGTISISNIGSIGGVHASPVLLPPEVCIMALGRVQTLPRFGPAHQVYVCTKNGCCAHALTLILQRGAQDHEHNLQCGPPHHRRCEHRQLLQHDEAIHRGARHHAGAHRMINSTVCVVCRVCGARGCRSTACSSARRT